MILILIRAAIAISVTGLSACASSQADAGSPNSTNLQPIKVVAAENFWGSIAKQLGGNRVEEVSIITNPDTDPHDYDPSAADGRTMAQAQLAVINGIGYDPWAAKLIAANPDTARRVVNVGNVVGSKDGDNPHRWYSPPDVAQVSSTITNELKAIDPKDATYFDMQAQNLARFGLSNYNGLISDIKQKYSGVPVGATESIFTPMAQALGLNLITPTRFLQAISEGSEPTATDKTTADSQIASNQIKVLVFNSQNATPDVQALVADANTMRIPVVSVTETLEPANASFQDWQTGQLQALQHALANATGR